MGEGVDFNNITLSNCHILELIKNCGVILVHQVRKVRPRKIQQSSKAVYSV
jgi:hypothetical protein